MMVTKTGGLVIFPYIEVVVTVAVTFVVPAKLQANGILKVLLIIPVEPMLRLPLEKLWLKNPVKPLLSSGL